MDVSCRGLDQPHQYHMLGDPNHDAADEENERLPQAMFENPPSMDGNSYRRDTVRAIVLSTDLTS